MWILILALVTLAAEFNPTWLVDRPGSPLARFFDDGSGVWPMTFGVLIAGAGLYGLIVVSTFEGFDWLSYFLESIIGFYVLKRTFTPG